MKKLRQLLCILLAAQMFLMTGAGAFTSYAEEPEAGYPAEEYLAELSAAYTEEYAAETTAAEEYYTEAVTEPEAPVSEENTVVTEPSAEIVTDAAVEAAMQETVIESPAVETVAETPAVEIIPETQATEAVVETQAVEIIPEPQSTETVIEIPTTEAQEETSAAEIVEKTSPAQNENNVTGGEEQIVIPQTEEETQTGSVIPEAQTELSEEIVPETTVAETEPIEEETTQTEEETTQALTWQTLTVIPVDEVINDIYNPSQLWNWILRSWDRNFYRTVSAEKKASQSTVEISGMLPENATAKVKVIELLEDDTYKAMGLYAYEITVFDAQGREFVPTEGTVTIKVRSAKITEAQLKGRAVWAYTYVNNTTEGQWENTAVVERDNIHFETKTLPLYMFVISYIENVEDEQEVTEPVTTSVETEIIVAEEETTAAPQIYFLIDPEEETTTEEETTVEEETTAEEETTIEEETTAEEETTVEEETTTEEETTVEEETTTEEETTIEEETTTEEETTAEEETTEEETEPEGPVIEDDQIIYAEDNIYLTGSLPVDGIVEATPVDVEIEGQVVLAAYDIAIYADEQQKEEGLTWQPEEDTVQIHIVDPELSRINNDEVSVFGLEHVDAEAELSDTAQIEEEEVVVDAGESSIVVITQQYLEKAININGTSYKITVAYDTTAGIPEGAELAVSEIQEDSEEYYLAQAADILGWEEDDSLFYAKVLDIRIMYGEEEIQPKTPVLVWVELLDIKDSEVTAAEATQALEVVHFHEAEDYTEAQSLDSRAYAIGTNCDVAFETDGFSTFVIAGVYRSVLTWETELAEVSVQGLNKLLAVDMEFIDAEEDVLVKGQELLESYEVNKTVSAGRSTGSVRANVTLDENVSLDELESVNVYSVKDGALEEIISGAMEPGSEVTVSLNGIDGFALVKDTGLRELTLVAEPAIGESIVLEGMVPVEAEAEAAVAETDVAAQIEEENVQNEIFCAYDISIVNHGEEFQPKDGETIAVEITNAAIGEAVAGGYELSLWHIADDGSREEIRDFTVEGNTVKFDAEGFSVYVVAGYMIEKIIEASDGNTYKVTLTFLGDALLPDDVELKVEELTDELRDDYIGRTATFMEASGFDYARVFDISLVDSNGTELQPNAEVQVSVELLDKENNTEEFSVVHFAVDENDLEESEQPELLATETEGNVVSFGTDGFSAYAIVQEPTQIPDAWKKISSVDELISRAANGVYIGHILGYYFTNAQMTISGSRTGIIKTKPAQAYPADEAALYYFVKTSDTPTFKVYCYANDGTTKRYVRQNGNSLSLVAESAATIFTVIELGNNKFTVKGSNNYYWNMQRGESGDAFAAWNEDNDPNAELYFWYYDMPVEDPYGLDGKSYGFMNWNHAATGRAMMASSTNENALDAKSLVVMNTAGYTSQLFVSNDSDISLWTFEWKTEDKYIIKTSAGANLYYLCIDESGLSLVQNEEEASMIQVIPGSGTHAGQICLKAGNYTLTYSGKVAEGFSVGGTVGSEWLYLVNMSELTEDYFRVYSASKVSISDSTKVKNGSKVILYTRVWNEADKCYYFYAVDSDGSLVRVYESGDSIEWVGEQLNSMLWNFVEYYWEDTGEPNGYYELYNQYSQKFIAPQITGDQILQNDTIGINMSGRQEGYYYSPIVAWDDGSYSYAGLKVLLTEDEGKVISCTFSEREDFYFAIVQDLPIDDELTTVPTVDHEQYGITMKMVNLESMNQMDSFLGSTAGGMGTALQQNLLSTNLVNGYPTAKKNNNRSLAELYAGETTVNHLFIASTYSGTGYYEYDSSQNYATLVDENGNIGNTFTVYKELGTHDASNRETLKHGQFFPYNNIEAGLFSTLNPKNIYTVTGANDRIEFPETDPRKYENLYLIDHPDYQFAMELEASFTQTPSGLDNWGHDIIYEFTGDDDFWLYVDGELVIDLGGKHSAVPGSVNFATGDVYVNGTHKTLKDIFYNNYKGRNHTAAEAQAYVDSIFKQGTSVFKDNTNHTMKIFYMERGAGASNLHMRFNLASVKPGAVELSKTISMQDQSESNLTDSVFAEFPYQIYYRIAPIYSVDLSDGGTYEWSSTNPNVATVDSNGIATALTDGETTIIATAGETVKTYDVEVRIVDGQKYIIAKSGEEYIGLTEEEYPLFDNSLVKYKNTTTNVTYHEQLTVNNKTYNHVFMLKPGQTAVISLPEEAVVYRIVECAVSTNVYSDVKVNNVSIDGTETEVANRQDYSINYASAADRPTVKYDNEVRKLQSLFITKTLYMEDGVTELTKDSENEEFRDETTFDFRLNLATEFASVEELNKSSAKMQQYHVKNTAGEYCKWDGTSFVTLGTGKTSFSSLTENEKNAATFHTSIYGKISFIPAGYTVEIPYLLPGTQYSVEERLTEIPDGYSRLGYSGLGVQDDVGIRSTIEPERDSEVGILNIRGFGLRVNKTWTDADYMESRDNTYFAIYAKVGETEIFVPGSLREMPMNVETLYWYYPNLPADETVTGADKIADYHIYEVKIEEGSPGPQVDPADPDHVVINEYELRFGKIEDNGELELEGKLIGDSNKEPYTYTVLYHESIARYSHLRINDVTNYRAGIVLKKTKWNGTEPLAGAEFELKETVSGTMIGTFTSDDDGLITVAYLRDDVNYTLTETKTPENWQSMQTPVCFTMNPNNGVTITSGNADYYNLEQADGTDMATLTIKNRPFTLKAVKEGENMDYTTTSSLPDVHFELHKWKTVDGTSGFDVRPESGYEDLVTDADGIIPGINENLKPGKYQLREKATPSGFYQLNGYIEFTISDTGVITIESHPEATLTSDTNEATGSVDYTMTIVNKRLIPSPTGLNLRFTPYLVMFGLGLILSLGAAFGIHWRRKRRDEEL